MPLRDHFRPPVSKRSSWEGFHGGWPMRIVEELAPRLPDGFVAEPRVHLGSYYEIDVCTFEQYEEGERVSGSARESNVAHRNGASSTSGTDPHLGCRIPGTVCLRSPDL